MDELREQIDEAGERRRQALALADSALNDVIDLVPDALAAGMSKDEVAELAGISRLTLDAIVRRRRVEAEFYATMPDTATEIARALSGR